MFEPLNPELVAASEAGVSMASLPVVALHGVTESQAAALEGMAIDTIFDLATSHLFNAANELVSISRTADSAERQLGILPSGIVHVDRVASIDALPYLGLAVLRDLNSGQIDDFENLFGIRTLLDLARWPGFHAARLVTGLGELPEEDFLDPGVPGELVPTFGEHASEKYYYRQFVVHDVDDSSVSSELDLSSHSLNPGIPDKHQGPPSRLRAGAMLSFQQTWTPQALALGNVLHSLALAPGESTNIAVIDWSRRHRLSSTESISEADRLQNLRERARAVSEVTDAVAYETVTGESSQESSSTTESSASSGFSVGGGSGQDNSSKNRVESASASSTSGEREMATSMAQNINDRTSQHASSSRNRRATVVRESLQRERETLTTRNITNYNHMHALSIQYFEVVQVYNVATALALIDFCLFVPYTPIEQWTGEILERYHRHWVDSALSPEIANRLMFPNVRLRIVAASRFLHDRSQPNLAGGRIDLSSVTVHPRRSATHRNVSHDALLRGIELWNPGNDTAIRPQGNLNLFYHIERIEADDQEIPVGTRMPKIPLNDVSRISLVAALDPFAAAAGREPVSLGAVLQIDDSDGRTAIEMRVGVTLKSSGSGGRAKAEIVRIGSDIYDETLLSHFRENGRYYNRQLLRRLTDAEFATLLECYAIDNEPLLNIVDSTPLAVAGSYLVFRLTREDLPSGTMLDRLSRNLVALRRQILGKGADVFESAGSLTLSERRIPVATGGTFVEAVQGRANSAEKIDLTRWWNWQESPIPLSAPQIEALESKSRARATDLTASGLSDALIELTESSDLPAPESLGQLVAALGRADLFDDLSGLNESIAAAQEALTSATRLSTTTGEQSSANLAAGLKLTAEAVEKMVAVVSKFATTLITAGVGAAGLPAPATAAGGGATEAPAGPPDNAGGAGNGTPPAGGGGGGDSGGGEVII